MGKDQEQPHAAKEEEEKDSHWKVERVSCKQVSLVTYNSLDAGSVRCWNVMNNVTFLPQASTQRDT